ncbi:MAG TPA: hypothetical protein VMZ31_17335 [Phycisphaerae bacterium]|nr:hypothetical protein [Phycisphaerae bacterium]
MEHWVDALLARKQPDSAGGLAAARSTACAEAAAESARTGQVVPLDASS